jgi:hypothetical protein
MGTDEAEVEGLEVTELTLMESNQEGDYLAPRQRSGTVVLTFAG